MHTLNNDLKQMKKPSVDVIEERLNNVITKLDEISDLLKIQNGRVGKLELWQNYVVGIGTTVVGVFTYLFSRK